MLLKPGQPRYRRYRRRSGARGPRVRRHSRRVVEVTRLGQPDQHRARDGRRAEGPRPSRGGRGAPWLAARGRRSCRPAACPCGRDGSLRWARLKITQTKSGIGGTQNQRDTLRTLGLKRIRDVVVKEDRPEIRGMVATVTHLVPVEEVDMAEREGRYDTERAQSEGPSPAAGAWRAQPPRPGSVAARGRRARPPVVAPRAPRLATRCRPASRVGRCRSTCGCPSSRASQPLPGRVPGRQPRHGSPSCYPKGGTVGPTTWSPRARSARASCKVSATARSASSSRSPLTRSQRRPRRRSSAGGRHAQPKHCRHARAVSGHGAARPVTDDSGTGLAARDSYLTRQCWCARRNA